MLTIQIPKKALAIGAGAEGGDGASETIMPEKNDPVDFRAEGVITAISGDMATVEIRFINGERPMVPATKKAAPDEDAEEEERMLREAQEFDASQEDEEF